MVRKVVRDCVVRRVRVVFMREAMYLPSGDGRECAEAAAG